MASFEIVYVDDYSAFVENVVRSCKEVEKLGRERPIEVLARDYKEILSANGAIVAEFGVAGGHTLQILAGAAGSNVVHGFDSFEGLPEDWRRGYGKGEFSTGGKVPTIRGGNVKFHVGWFDATIPDFVKDVMGGSGSGKNIALLHVDCDLYSSTKTIFEGLGEFIRDTIVVFDELIGYETFEKHEIKALWEWMGSEGGVKVEILKVRGENVGCRVRRGN
jgi:hypothetical protein